MCTTCNCFKHKSKDIYYTAFRVILIKNMINKRNHTMTTVRHDSQYCSLRYSFSFSHKFRGLVGSSSLLQSWPYAKTRIIMHQKRIKCITAMVNRWSLKLYVNKCKRHHFTIGNCLLYTSDAADE